MVWCVCLGCLMTIDHATRKLLHVDDSWEVRRSFAWHFAIQACHLLVECTLLLDHHILCSFFCSNAIVILARFCESHVLQSQGRLWTVLLFLDAFAGLIHLLGLKMESLHLFTSARFDDTQISWHEGGVETEVGNDATSLAHVWDPQKLIVQVYVMLCILLLHGLEDGHTDVTRDDGTIQRNHQAVRREGISLQVQRDSALTQGLDHNLDLLELLLEEQKVRIKLHRLQSQLRLLTVRKHLSCIDIALRLLQVLFNGANVAHLRRCFNTLYFAAFPGIRAPFCKDYHGLIGQLSLLAVEQVGTQQCPCTAFARFAMHSNHILAVLLLPRSRVVQEVNYLIQPGR
mmetsp:Transcript_63057/g.150257  ORF Transcript_63057/g.150257 Transcript_63057/m.150257 type:complete len:344 (-) Transcript_63057:1160-2191(-)